MKNIYGALFYLVSLAGIQGCGGGGGQETTEQSEPPLIYSFSSSEYVSSSDLDARLRWSIESPTGLGMTCRIYIGESQVPQELINDCTSNASSRLVFRGSAVWSVRLEVRDERGSRSNAEIQVFTGSASSQYAGESGYTLGDEIHSGGDSNTGGDSTGGGTETSATSGRTIRFVVNTYEDTQDGLLNDGRCADETGLCSIRAAVMESNQLCATTVALPRTCEIVVPAGDYVMTRASSYVESDGLWGDINITGKVVISGDENGLSVIDGNADNFNERVFTISKEGVASFSHITISNAKTKNWNYQHNKGSALLNQGKLQLDEVEFSNNSSTDDGGALYHEGLYLHISNSRFFNNTAVSGGAIAIKSAEKTPSTIESSIFTGNKATSQGGGLYVQSTVTLNEVVMEDNLSRSNGGALYVSMSGNATVQRSSLYQNRLRANTSNYYASDFLYGGGIYNAGNTRLINTTIAENHAVLTRCCEMLGGAIYNAGTLSISFSTIADNKIEKLTTNTTTVETGGIYNTDRATLALKSTIIARNYLNETPANCRGMSGTITSYGYNLFTSTSGCAISYAAGDDVVADTLLGLNPLSDNGGPSKTLSIEETSPAYDRRVGRTCTAIGGTSVSVDQRGVYRSDGACDSGAYER